MNLSMPKKIIILTGVIIIICAGVFLFMASNNTGNESELSQNTNLVFIHHSVGDHWLNNSLNEALIAKPYIGKVNDTYYGTALSTSADRPDSLPSRVGDYTNMDHWIFWFNDYLEGVKSQNNPEGFVSNAITPVERKITARYPSLAPYFDIVKSKPDAKGNNKIIMFKSCFPNSDLYEDSTDKGDPFSGNRTIANNQAIFRHPDGPGNTYTHNGYEYKPLEDIFAENPDTLFIFVTNPPLHYAPNDATNDENARRNREFNAWLKNEWLDSYKAAHPDVNNVAIFDFFDALAYPDDDAQYPNRLMAEFGGDSGDSHPNDAANLHATQVFATNAENFIDQAWHSFQNGK